MSVLQNVALVPLFERNGCTAWIGNAAGEREVCNLVLDLGLLVPQSRWRLTCFSSRESKLSPTGVLRDRGYKGLRGGWHHRLCAPADPWIGGKPGYFTKESFRYNSTENIHLHPGEATLYSSYEGKLWEYKKIEYCDHAAFWSLSGISRQLKPRNGITPCWTNQ